MGQHYIRWVPGPKTLQRISKLHVRLYRASFGRIGTRVDGLDILLLSTRGRKTGQWRTAPLPYFRDDDRLVVVASNGGTERHPAWFLNLLEHPAVRAQLGPRTLQLRALPLHDGERTRVWDNITREHPRYRDYARKTARNIPVVALEPL